MSRCRACNGTAFIHGLFLVTKYSDPEIGAAWTTKQLLSTDEQVRAVRANLKPNQQIFEGSKMCICHGAIGSPDAN